ncbi:exodeoxyribonuclease III [Methylocystis heyeri]|uniref:Exodeoxyribonuclease III n=1 Tax=Methylocystis heyeri TaxID=391905 RepID=A0A6B8KFP4_9HYPH|nr:exodeoxyribonuclease III [Methylocystis heyeri]QGM45313.1 exodeoxyribonuclease III [Methylocystis heyeri]
MKITTWNINSVRLRMPLVVHFLKTNAPDVICLQETKCRDAEFPSSDLRALGYEHLAVNGQKGYHGVAIASKLPVRLLDKQDFCDAGHARHVAVEIDAGGAPLSLHNFYVPAGGDEPDETVNPKFAHKLGFLDEMTEWIKRERIAAGRSVLVGDLNIAPLEHDVWSHKALLKVVSHTPIEVEKLNKMFEAGEWIDSMRRFVPPQEKLYTWWSYRASDWAASDRGRRLDHVLVSQALGGALAGLQVAREARGWERPSDHVPVTVELSL